MLLCLLFLFLLVCPTLAPAARGAGRRPVAEPGAEMAQVAAVKALLAGGGEAAHGELAYAAAHGD